MWVLKLGPSRIGVWGVDGLELGLGYGAGASWAEECGVEGLQLGLGGRGVGYQCGVRLTGLWLRVLSVGDEAWAVERSVWAWDVGWSLQVGRWNR